jgi:hypothetical protein
MRSEGEEATVSDAAQTITVRPVLWRSLLFPLLYGLAAALMVSVVILVFAGDWPQSFWPVIAGGATGLAIGLLTTWRGLPLELDSQSLCGPSRWTRSASLTLDEIDWRPEPRPGLTAWFLGQRVVRARDGSRKVIIDRWQYRPDEVRRLLAELDRLAGERVRGA